MSTKSPQLEQISPPPSFNPSITFTPTAVFNHFEAVSLASLKTIVDKLKPSACPTDVIPPRLFKEVWDTVGPNIQCILNSSLASGIVPMYFKQAVVQPLIKKPNLDSTVLSNFRPISKLPFISKILEKVVLLQLQEFLDNNSIFETFQSGFKALHSTESALLRVFNDLLITTDTGDFAILMLLDLTAAFDTIDHTILISHLEHGVGIKGTALEWFKSYVTGRGFTVSIGGSMSSPAPLPSGVPQGSILGPILFALYLLPLGSILRKHGMSFHFYADDSQIYLPIKRNSTTPVSQLLKCLVDIKAWMALNFLNLNESKTEIIVFRPSVAANISDLALGPLEPYLKPTVTNLGVKMDCDFLMDKQVNSVLKSAFFQRLKAFLSFNDFEKVIHAFITTRLDYCNALYFGVSHYCLHRLQLIQNAAARLLTGTRRHDHISPVLSALHWLPVRFRINFKILLFVFKSRHGLAPSYISDLLKPYVPTRSLRSAGKMLLEVPKSKLVNRGDRAFSVAAPKLWNELPLHIKQSPSLSVFKTRLKTLFYSQAFISE